MKRFERSAWLTCLALLVSAFALAAEETAVVKDAHVNVRGQPSLVGEVITQLQQGEKVVVLEEVTLAKPKTNEPPRWARIRMPANTPVWVYAPFVDTTNKVVKVTRLNLRAGPGENFSVIGRLERGNPINEIRRTGDWIEIETPPTAYAFIAADLLTKGENSTAASTPSNPEPVKTVTPVKPPPEPAPQHTQASPSSTSPAGISSPGPDRSSSSVPTLQLAPAVPAPTTVPGGRSRELALPGPAPSRAGSTTSTNTVVVGTKPVAASGPTVVLPARTQTAPAKADLAKLEEAPPRRVVRREGLVRSTVSIQAPTYYELLNPDNRKTINYLHTEALGFSLKDYRGRRIIVTGEEAIDPRWPKTPVIEVDKLELIP